MAEVRRVTAEVVSDKLANPPINKFYNSDTSQSPLFTVNVVGHGIAGGTYRFIDNGGGDMLYLDNCCARITITAMPSNPGYEIIINEVKWF